MDLDRYIEGQIGFDDIQGYIHEDIPIQRAIINFRTFLLLFRGRT